MKKILIGILIILLIVMAYFAIFRGISIGNINILSVEQIGQENKKLETEIAETETLIRSNYASQVDGLNKSVDDLMLAKEEYSDLANISTQSEINKANRQETYKIEYLWTRIGSHATRNGITLKLDVTSGETGESDVKNLSFTAEGSYSAIILFLRAIEDDSQLAFRIENFKILPGIDSTSRQGTFVVRNVRIKQETVNTTQATNTNTNNTNTTNENTDANTTTNTAGESTNNQAQTNTNSTVNNTNINEIVNQTAE